jgi:dUTP pyrophosphatase
MNVRIKLLNDKAVVPAKKYGSDFCYDVTATSCEEIAPDVYKYGTGLAFQIVRGQEPLEGANPEKWLNFQKSNIRLSIDARPRSSVWKTGLVLSNCEGTIDEDYRGEVSFVFYHVNKSLPIYKVGDRIGQIKLGLTLPIDFDLVCFLDDTERGDGAYGSTGK